MFQAKVGYMGKTVFLWKHSYTRKVTRRSFVELEREVQTLPTSTPKHTPGHALWEESVILNGLLLQSGFKNC